MPSPSPAQLDALGQIALRDPSTTLRFTFIASSGRNDSFVVFDALDGPCIDRAGGYPLLNADPALTVRVILSAAPKTRSRRTATGTPCPQ